MAAFERVVRGAYDLGALGATDEGDAALRGAAAGGAGRARLSALTPDGVVRTRGRGRRVSSCRSASRSTSGELTCDWRDGDVW